MQIQSLSLAGKVVLMRVDFNVPTDGKGHITDDTRLRAALPTIQYLTNNLARVVLVSHLGRPKKGADGTFDPLKFSLAQVVPALSELLGQKVGFVQDCVGESVHSAVKALANKEVLLLENLRYYPEEEAGDAAFARKLAEFADIYVNDAFGTAHRAHASTCTVAQYFEPSEKAVGFLMGKELEAAQKILHAPARPFVAIVGGAKVSDKILLLESLLDKVDTLIIGGGMAYTLLKAQGANIGKSLVETDKLELAARILAKAQSKGVELLLPTDSLTAAAFSNDANISEHPSTNIPDTEMGLDIGSKARAAFSQRILNAKTIFWNGPMGVFEFSNFAEGTKTVAQAVVAASQQNGAFSLIGGGDSVAAIQDLGLADKVGHVSTGGGAMLELIENGFLPGQKAVE